MVNVYKVSNSNNNKDYLILAESYGNALKCFMEQHNISNPSGLSVKELYWNIQDGEFYEEGEI